VRASSVAKLGGITKLSQIASLPVDQRTFCVESEFYSRSDGFKPMLKKYGLAIGPNGVPRKNVKILDTGAVYEATARGACNFGEVFTTDGRINSLDLKVLTDDKKFFPAYNIAPMLQTSTLKKYPQLKKVFGQIAAKLTNKAAVKFNYQVDVLGKEPADVAFDWMKKEGLINAP
jgi:osmoprotectant transport system substrate-binding protein